MVIKFFLLIIQLLEKQIPDMELNGIRVSLPWLGCILILLITRCVPTIPREYLPLCIATIILQNISSLSGYIAVTFISLASYQCILNTVLLTSGVVVHRLINKDMINVSKILAICACTVGICLVVQPEFLYPVLGLSIKNNQSDDGIVYDNVTSQGDKDSLDEVIGYILTGICGLIWCLDIAMNRRMTSSQDFRQYYVSYLFWHFTFGVLSSTVLMLVCIILSI